MSADNIRVLFGTKPDGSGWTSQPEMNSTREENLVFYDSLEALNATGRPCVAVLYEVRDVNIYPGYWKGHLPIKVRKDVVIGDVYETMNDVRIWTGSEKVPSWTDVGGGTGQGEAMEGYRDPLITLYNTTNYEKSVYSNGGISAGHTGGFFGGNSLLIIGCKTEISIQTANKDVYDLDNGERTAHFVLKPSVLTISENSDVVESDDVTDVTIVVTLPAGLTYDPGGDTEPEPVSIVKNPDGTSTVTWLLKNCKIGDPVPDILFDCSIGNPDGVDDVKNGDILTVKAVISSDKDKRVQTAEFKNYSETAIHIVQLAELSITKSTEKPLVEKGDDLEFTINLNNKANGSEGNVHTLDVFPFNGDGRGTNIHGSYGLSKIILDYSEAPNTLAHSSPTISVTTSKNIQNEDTAMQTAKNGVESDPSWKQLTGQTTEGTTITWTGMESGVTGVFFNIGTVNPKEHVRIILTLTPDEEQEPGDLYENNFIQSAESSDVPITSNNVNVQVVRRTLNGLAWIDRDGNGIRDDTETLKPGITVSLYSTASAHSNTDFPLSIGGKTLYPAYDVFDYKIDPVQTMADGTYSFANLAAGTYYVLFSNGEDLELTQQNTGRDDTVDSDTTTDGNVFYISEITLPVIDEMTSWSCESEHNDIGLIEPEDPSVVLPFTGGPGNRGVVLLSLLFLSMGAMAVVLKRKI